MNKAILNQKERKLTFQEAEQLIQLPLSCIDQEYPNKLNQVLGDSSHLQSPSSLHPAFYGCFDWHSAVHGHWSIVRLLKKYPEIKGGDEARKMLAINLSKEKIQAEINYFINTYNRNYERTYGWAWLLKLTEELHNWEDPLADTLFNNVKPLTDTIVSRYLEYLPKLLYPIRVGEHTNTAFGLAFAYDYATTFDQKEFRNQIEKAAINFYADDKDCPLTWEPSGYDFLSPCLEEAHLMSKIYDKDQFLIWIKDFMPSLLAKDFYLEPGQVSDRSDGKLVHLDGVNFSRAWCFFNIAEKLDDPLAIRANAYNHINHSISNLVGDDYEGGHWLASFAIYALEESEKND